MTRPRRIADIAPFRTWSVCFETLLSGNLADEVDELSGGNPPGSEVRWRMRVWLRSVSPIGQAQDPPGPEVLWRRWAISGGKAGPRRRGPGAPRRSVRVPGVLHAEA